MALVSKFCTADSSHPPPQQLWDPAVSSGVISYGAGLWRSWWMPGGWKHTVCILTVVRTLMATISSHQCLSPPCCLKSALVFSSTLFYFIWSTSTDLGDLSLLGEELPCPIRLKAHLGSDSIFNYGSYEVFGGDSRNLLPMGSACKARDAAR